MYPQRRPLVVTDESRGRRPWSPPVLADLDGGTLADPAVRYVVVDDLEDRTAVLVVAPWPQQDGHGRLTFGDPARRRMWTVPAAALHLRVSGERGRQGQEAPTRALRIGDAFFTVVSGHLESVDSFELIRDVTAEARVEAKLAHFAAVTPRVSPAYAREVGLAESADEDVPGPDGPGPSASPAV